MSKCFRYVSKGGKHFIQKMSVPFEICHPNWKVSISKRIYNNNITYIYNIHVYISIYVKKIIQKKCVGKTGLPATQLPKLPAEENLLRTKIVFSWPR